MTRHRSGLWLVVMGVSLLTGSVFGQAVSQIPPSVRSATSLTSAQQQMISDAVAVEVKALQSQDPVVQQRAREALVDGVRDQGQLTNSFVYKRHYASALNQELSALPDNADLRTRLNAAIVTARVAELVQSSQLSRAARKFMSDEALPVALWGMKAARWILPYEAANALFSANNELLRAIPAAVKAHQESGALVEEAYETLYLQLNVPDIPKPPAESLRIVVPVVQQIIDDRIELKEEGVVESPAAEKRGFDFLAHPDVYRAQGAADRLHTAQLLSESLALAAAKVTSGAEDRAVYYQIMRDLGSAVTVVGTYENNPSIQNAGRAVAGIQNNNTADEIAAAVSATFKALKAAPSFNDLKLPPLAPATNGGSQSTAAHTVAGGR